MIYEKFQRLLSNRSPRVSKGARIRSPRVSKGSSIKIRTFAFGNPRVSIKLFR